MLITSHFLFFFFLLKLVLLTNLFIQNKFSDYFIMKKKNHHQSFVVIFKPKLASYVHSSCMRIFHPLVWKSLDSPLYWLFRGTAMACCSQLKTSKGWHCMPGVWTKAQSCLSY